MSEIQCLQNIGDLKRSRFGQPSPRHGLELLFWFAREYIEFDNNNQLTMKYDPRSQQFGFHSFKNRVDNLQDGRLLPHHYPYYEVGNLHSAGAEQLPSYVRKKYTGRIDNSNTDRLIIAVNSNGKLSKVYVTQHDSLRDFSHEGTYQVSKNLLQNIHNMSSCEVFLNRVHGIARQQPQGTRKVRDPGSDEVTVYMASVITESRGKPKKCCPCTIL